jgi:hypothetical protein
VRIGNQHFAGSAPSRSPMARSRRRFEVLLGYHGIPTIAQATIKILLPQLLMYYTASVLALRERTVGSAANTADSPNHNEKGPRHG